jgi:hypothetical protein
MLYAIILLYSAIYCIYSTFVCKLGFNLGRSFKEIIAGKVISSQSITIIYFNNDNCFRRERC